MAEDRESKLITVATFNDGIQAVLSRERLEASGITALIPDEHAAQMTGVPIMFGGVRLQVFEPDEEQARRILTTECDPQAELAIERENPIGSDQPAADEAGHPVCPACKSDLVYLADYRIGQILKSMLLLGIPLLFIQRDMTCKSCGHRWNPATGLRS